ncbi:MAG: OmpH family outer membrane protein [Flavobacteriales bacterium]|nr:OmpH family outer membrane protein [Flavobacteriales bacterium]
MKNILVLFVVFLSLDIYAQKIGYVDTDFIIEQMPAYRKAQSQLDAQVKVWQKEVKEFKQEVTKLKEDYNNEKILLTDSQIQEREEQIKQKEEELEKLIDKRFGEEGDIMKFRTNSAQPVQDQIFNAIKKVSDKKNYSFIVDKSGSGIDFLYSDGRYDVTNLVLKELGLGQYLKEAKIKEKEDKEKERELRRLKIDQERKQRELDKIRAKEEKEKDKVEEIKAVEDKEIDAGVVEEQKQKSEPKQKSYEDLSDIEKIKRKAEQLKKEREKNNK